LAPGAAASIRMGREFPCYLVTKGSDGQVRGGIATRSEIDLPAGDVLVEVAASSLNYKDALAATGHPGVAKSLPHVPGIDCAGRVIESSSPRFAVGDEVLITGYGLGEDRWGGWAGLVRMPADFVVPLPVGLSLVESMIYGTAGFTAAQSVLAIQERGIEPGRGPVLVTGASGGVGTLAVALLAKAGFEVVAVTGKTTAHDQLSRLGAKSFLGRDDVVDSTSRPLLSSRWSAAIDTVGGQTLATIVRSTMHRAVIAVCGLVGGAELPLTVYPFLLRGVNLVGIDSAKCPMPSRLAIWSLLAGKWKVDRLGDLAETIDLSGIDAAVQRILAGQVTGRIVVVPRP
jgi:putative YhdH/YhfP family quinone oxidoreductase